MALITINRHYDDAKLDKIITLLKRIGEVMATQMDIDRVTDKLEKVRTEIHNMAETLRQEIADLKATAPVPLDLSRLEAIADEMDSMNPDAPTDEEVA